MPISVSFFGPTFDKVLGLNRDAYVEEGADNRFEGMTFVLTGSLENYSRKEAEDIIEKFGGKASRFCFKENNLCNSSEKMQAQN